VSHIHVAHTNGSHTNESCLTCGPRREGGLGGEAWQVMIGRHVMIAWQGKSRVRMGHVSHTNNTNQSRLTSEWVAYE